MRPVLEIMFIDFITLALDQLVNGAAKAHFMSGGQLTVPMVLRTQGGAGQRGAAQHSQSLESWLTHVPGLKVVMPSRPVDAAGLLASAIADPNPVVFIESKTLYFRKGDVPDSHAPVPIGEAVTLRTGGDVTIVALSRLVHDALAAAERLAAEHGIEAEVIDPRTLVPLDLEAIVDSVRRTGRLVVAHEAVEHGGFGAEIAAQVQAAAFDYLDAPIERVGAPFAPDPTEPAARGRLPARRGRHRRGGPEDAAVIAAVTEAVGSMRVRDVPEPGEPGPGQVVVRPTAVGICGSDFHFFEGRLSEHAGGSGFPRIQGHEVAATVEAVGPGCRDGLDVGQTVALFPLTACGHCYPCRIGRPNVCVNFSLIGDPRGRRAAGAAPDRRRRRCFQSTVRARRSQRSSSRCRLRCGRCTVAGSPRASRWSCSARGRSGSRCSSRRRIAERRCCSSIRSRTGSRPPRALGAETVPVDDARRTSSRRYVPGAAAKARRS